MRALRILGTGNCGVMRRPLLHRAAERVQAHHRLDVGRS